MAGDPLSVGRPPADGMIGGTKRWEESLLERPSPERLKLVKLFPLPRAIDFLVPSSIINLNVILQLFVGASFDALHFFDVFGDLEVPILISVINDRLGFGFPNSRKAIQ